MNAPRKADVLALEPDGTSGDIEAYVHCDLDVLHPGVCRVNPLPATRRAFAELGRDGGRPHLEPRSGDLYVRRAPDSFKLSAHAARVFRAALLLEALDKPI